MIRRRLLVLLGFIALGALLPCAPVGASPMSNHRHAMPPGHCDEGQTVAHLCLGCVVDPAAPTVPTPIVALSRLVPPARLVSALPSRRSGLDPPPPRLS